MHERSDIKAPIRLEPAEQLEAYRLLTDDFMDNPSRSERVRLLRGLLSRLAGLEPQFADGPLADDYHKLVSHIKLNIVRFDEYIDIDQMTAELYAAAEEPVSPHFGLDARQEVHWAGVYQRLVRLKWLNREEVNSSDWVYVCCGLRSVPKRRIVWHGGTAVLHYIVKRYFNSQWDVAKQVFVLSDNKELPTSLANIQDPVEKTCKMADEAFRKEQIH